MKKRLFISVVLLASILGALPLSAQESCYAQYLREHNMRVLTAEDADDSYDELKKTVLAWQMYGSEASLPLRPIEEPAAPKQQDTTYVIVHLALVDSTWYMWMSVDPLADKYPGNTPYLYCNGNPIMLVDPDGRSTKTAADGQVETVVDDGDLGVYRWNEKLKQYEKMGESLQILSFANQSKYNKEGVIVADQNLRIEFESNEWQNKITTALNSKMTIWDYMKAAKQGGPLDYKSKSKTGSMINGKYASPRDAGNVLAGAFKASCGIFSPVIQYGYGAYNLSKNQITTMMGILCANALVGITEPIMGVGLLIRVYNGEDKLSQLCINIGQKFYFQGAFPSAW